MATDLPRNPEELGQLLQTIEEAKRKLEEQIATAQDEIRRDSTDTTPVRSNREVSFRDPRLLEAPEVTIAAARDIVTRITADVPDSPVYTHSSRQERLYASREPVSAGYASWAQHQDGVEPTGCGTPTAPPPAAPCGDPAQTGYVNTFMQAMREERR